MAKMRPKSRKEFEIAIVCALSVEFDAVEDLFDEHYVAYGKQRGDLNFYRTGRIGKYNTVLAHLPEMGKKSAASAASSLLISFPGIHLTILTGVCGGVPFPSSGTEVVLGDAIVSSKVAEYDFGKFYPDGFQQRVPFTDTLGRADRDIRSLLAGFKTRRLQYEFQGKHLSLLTHLQNVDERWQYPGATHDRLFEAFYRHKHQQQTEETSCICMNCNSSEDPVCGQALESDCNELGCSEHLIERTRLTARNPSPRVHFGALGCGDTVMKSGEHRDNLAKRTGVMGFEMEGVGICDTLRCIIVKGVCDYADSHKNKAWQEYAAASAASCTKAFLEVMWETVKEGDEQHRSNVETERRETGAIENLPKDYPNQFLGNDSSVAINSSENGQSVYRWTFSSRTSSNVNTINHHNESLEQELERLKMGISNPFLRQVLVSGVIEALKNNHGISRTLQTTRCLYTSSYKSRFGNIIYQTKVIKQSITAFGETSVHYKTTTSFIFYPASWLIRIGLRYGIEATSIDSQTGWKYSISPVRAVQDDALIFRFCKLGNTNAVKELLKRDASVVDVNSQGWRPLHFATANGHYELAKFLISQGADKTAPTYESPFVNRHTPASLFFPNRNIKQATEMILLFDDCIDFEGSTSDGWNLVSSVEFDEIDFKSHNDICFDILSLLFRKFYTDYTSSIDAKSINDCLYWALYMSDIKSVRLILHFILDFEPNLLSYFSKLDEEPAFYIIARVPHACADILKLLVDKGTDIHVAYCGETATSKALWFSHTCFPWFKRLGRVYPDLDKFIERESSPGSLLAQDNWNCDTLRDLLNLTPFINFDYTDEYATSNASCRVCSGIHPMIDYEVLIEPWWEELKHRVRNKKCTCCLLERAEDWIIDNDDVTICSLCRMCREKRLEKTSQDSGLHAVEIDLSDGVDSQDSEDGYDGPRYSRLGLGRWVLDRFFYIQGGIWNEDYLPNEYYCFKCLAESEGWGVDFDEDNYYCFRCLAEGEDCEVDSDTETSSSEIPEESLQDELIDKL